MINQFEVSSSAYYEDTKGDTKYRKQVTWGRSRSSQIAPTDRRRVPSY